MDRHNESVALVASKVRQFHDQKQAFKIYHGSTNSTRNLSFQRSKTVDTSQLSHVLKVNSKERTVLVEPNVPMDKLVAATIPFGLVPPVVMEFPGITAGGGFAGTGAESSSFKFGNFDSTVNWVEMVLANGDLTIASSTKCPDLFHGAAASFGTLGVVTLLELQLIEAKTYVELTYFPINHVFDAISRVKTSIEDSSNDFVDGILFELHRGLIITGKLTNVVQDNIRIQRVSRARDPWFFVHAKRVLAQCSRSTTVKEAMPLVDYLFRYDRGAFWTGAYAFKYFMTPFNRITRWALDPFMHTRTMYKALHASGHSQRYIIQDLALPFDTVQDFVRYVDDDFGFYPLWLCPLLQSHEQSLHPFVRSSEQKAESPRMLLNVGVWGPGPLSQDEFVAINRRLERKVQELSGIKWLYAHAYYTEDEFWTIYDRESYDALRDKYHASLLPTIYDKVKVDVDMQKQRLRNSWCLWILSFIWQIWPLSGLWGVLMAIVGGDYLLAKR